MRLFLRLGWFFRDHKATYTAALLMLTVVAALNMIIPWLVAQAVDRLVATPDQPERTYTLLILLAAGALIIYLMRVGWRLMLFGTSYRLGHHLRKAFYARLAAQGQAFYSRHNTGDLMARATNDIDAIEVAAGEGILSGFDGALTFVLVLVMMFAVIDWRLTLVALIPFPLMGYYFYRISNRIHHQFHDALEAFSGLNDMTQESMTGIRLIRSMGLEEVQSNEFNLLSNRAADINYQVARSEAMYEPVVFLSLAGAMLLTLSYGAWLIVHTELSVGELTGFTLYLVQLIWPMFAFGWLLNIVERGSAALKRVENLLETPDSVPDNGSLTPQSVQISVDNLSFHHLEEQTETLSQIGFDLGAGQRLGIAGPTGAGKTTLIQLLMRYWELDDTQMILLDGQPLRAYRLEMLRRAFAYVPQDPFLFSLSVGENIALYRPDATMDEIRRAASLAAIGDEIEHFPEGYDTPVGERGIALSGGQRQRLAIARAILTQAPVLILDDALSAVDSRTEQQILQRLQQEMRNRTTIIISHRLSTLRQCDNILVLAHGELIESGPHDALLSRDGWYARMWTYQQLEADFDDAAG
ncbi:multidrug ABC transporter permease/ATP-binding protein [Marinobacterium zhoushanense]|uniref:Multidrug ABC transporter permease/ATP-binding protein n=1 Tax=Marinobacterium zhoushanense TaxID=1679163 RepID=A0ABQ1KG41_9GAMM|nr:ABC transporter transmembrane domain-containing protein [Marinobacterium zhoushanense]GGB93326.1 multidrug ABC transporter permease/ATP-binding protein [Marinobacterium zhoushanense]